MHTQAHPCSVIVCLSMCVCVCVHIYLSVCLFTCVCVCVCLHCFRMCVCRSVFVRRCVACLSVSVCACVYLVSGHVGLQQGVLLLQVLDAGQVLAVVVGGQLALHLVQPQLDVLHVAVELLLLVGLAQLDAWGRGDQKNR